MSFAKAVENRFNRLRQQKEQGRISEDEFLREVEKLQFEDEHGRLWMIDAYSGNWYFEENGQWVSDEPPDFEPAIRCSRCGKPVQEIGASMCSVCQEEIAAVLAQAKSSKEASSTERPSTSQVVGPQIREQPALDSGSGSDPSPFDSDPSDAPTSGKWGLNPRDTAAHGRGWGAASGHQRAQFFYERGVEFFDARNWRKALDFFEQALQLDRDYRDAKKLAQVARAKLSDEKDQRLVQSKLKLLYERAEQHTALGEWHDAYDLLQEVLALDANYRDVQALSERAASELGIVEERRRQSSAFEALYEQAESDFRQRQWDAAISLLTQIQDLDPTHLVSDPRYVVARDMLTEAQRQQRLGTLYGEAVGYLQNGKLEAAIGALRQVVKLDARSAYRDAPALLDETERKARIERLYAAGLESLAAERWSEAVNHFEPVVQAAPDYKMVYSSWLYAKGMQAAHADDWAPAIEALNQLLLRDASYRDAAAQLARSKTQLRLKSAYEEGAGHLDAGEWQEAVRAYEMVAALDPNYPGLEERFTKARAELELAELYEKGMRLAEGNRLADAITLFEQIHAKREDYRDAAERVTQWKRLRRVSEMYAQGVAALQMGKWSEAIIDLKRAVEIDSSYRDAPQRLKEAQRQERLQDLYQRGMECFHAKDWARTIDYFEHITKEDAVYRDAAARLLGARRQKQLTELYREGESGFAEGRWPDALSAFEKMLALDPTDEWGVMARMRESRRQRDLAELYTQATKLYNEHKWEEATGLFERLLEQEPNYRDSTLRLKEIDLQEQLVTLYTRAGQYRDAGQWQAALDSYGKVLKLDPSYKTAAADLEEVSRRKKLAEMYQEGQALMEQKRWARAIEVFGSLATLEPGQKEAAARLAEAHKLKNLADQYAEAMRDLEQGRFRDAVDGFEKVVSVEPDYADVKVRLDEARLKQKVDQLLERAKSFFEQGDWGAAAKTIHKVLELDADAERGQAAQNLLQLTQRQMELAQYYEAGLRYFQNRQWAEAIDFLGRVIRQKPDYRDAAARLQVATKQQELDRLYVRAQEHLRTEQWAEAAHVLKQIVAIDPQYVTAARQLEQAEARLRSRVNALYEKGKEHLTAGRWQAAIQILEQLKSEQADLPDLDRLLREARAWKEQTELAALYEQGMACLLNDNLEQAADCFERLKSRAPGYKDVEEQLKRVRQRRLRAYVTEPAVQPQPARQGFSLASTVFVAIGVFFCCLSAAGVVAIASQSFPLASLVMQGPAPSPVVMVARPTLADQPVTAVVPLVTTMPIVVELTTTNGLTLTATLPTPDLLPRVEPLRLPELPTAAVAAAPVVTDISAAPAGANVGVSIPQLKPGESKPLIKVPPAVQGRPTRVAANVAITATAVTNTAALTDTKKTTTKATPKPPTAPGKTAEAAPAPLALETLGLAGKIAFSVYEPGPRRFSVYTAGIDGAGMTALQSDASAPALSPDGNQVAFRSWTNSDRRIVISDLKTGEFRRMTGYAEDGRPDWSAEGVLAFDSTRESDRRSRIYTVGTWQGAKDAPIQGPNGAVQGDNPTWLGTGRVAYSACPSGGCGIYVINVDGAGQMKVVDTQDRTSLDGSPDGQRIVYAARQDGNWDIFVIGADGGGGKRLTTDAAMDWLPTWSPDGKNIAFVSNRGGNWAIWAMAADGANVRKLFDLPGAPDGVVRDEPAWSSQGWIEERISWVP